MTATCSCQVGQQTGGTYRFCCSQGSVLTCPSGGFKVDKTVPAGYLEGLSCQTTSSSGAIQQVPLHQVVKVASGEKGMSGGAVFGIVVAVLVALSAIGYLIWCVSTYRSEMGTRAQYMPVMRSHTTSYKTLLYDISDSDS